MTEDERQQIIALGLDPDKLDPHHPSYDPNYGDDLDPKNHWDENGRLIGLTPEMGHKTETKYKPEFATMAKVMCRNGATDLDLAEAFSVSLSTITVWRGKHKAFREAADWKKYADDAVEKSYYMRAKGYRRRVEKLFQYEGEIIRAETYEDVLPDVRAGFNWLKNRRRHEWKDRHEITGADGAPLIPSDETSVLQAARLIAFRLQQGKDIEERGKLIEIEAVPVETKKEE